MRTKISTAKAQRMADLLALIARTKLSTEKVFVADGKRIPFVTVATEVQRHLETIDMLIVLARVEQEKS